MGVMVILLVVMLTVTGPCLPRSPAWQSVPCRSGGKTITLRERANRRREVDVFVDSRAPVLLALLRWCKRITEGEEHKEIVLDTDPEYYAVLQQLLGEYGYTVIDSSAEATVQQEYRRCGTGRGGAAPGLGGESYATAPHISDQQDIRCHPSCAPVESSGCVTAACRSLSCRGGWGAQEQAKCGMANFGTTKVCQILPRDINGTSEVIFLGVSWCAGSHCARQPPGNTSNPPKARRKSQPPCTVYAGSCAAIWGFVPKFRSDPFGVGAKFSPHHSPF